MDPTFLSRQINREDLLLEVLLSCAREQERENKEKTIHININPKSVKEEPQDDRKFQFIIKSG
jgi:hypothetical protein